MSSSQRSVYWHISWEVCASRVPDLQIVCAKPKDARGEVYSCSRRTSEVQGKLDFPFRLLSAGGFRAISFLADAPTALSQKSDTSLVLDKK